ncbi:uncharacterized protein EV422DRAFT_396002 [Fimicolochytrium jonesii]|uniref:uncharacterized protein n=1 Tax=Fimicolochytrium jonesii TaxID=1396493 RepID=UPI0022FF2D84|nr:uncharacterized protein EV422DRAFT_396002 [Fimicolochytrium jonesii]KAI8822367.1 hypothetical protein EV422DRAFT_396002 [Fimicolochytrium jonesii]
MAVQAKLQQSSLVQSVAGQVMPLISTAQSYAVTAISTSKAILDRYPPIKAFVYTLGGAAAVPLAVFTGYGAATGAVVLGVAGTGVAMVQGGFLAFGGFVLFWFLAGALIFSAIATFWFTLAYFAFQIAKRLEGSA